MSLRERVARNLRQLRHAKGLSQEELCSRANLDRNYVGKLEREENAATTDTLEKLAVALGVDAIEFFYKDPPDPSSTSTVEPSPSRG